MVCEHLAAVESALLEAGIPVISREQAWTDNCREWVYFDGFLDTASLRRSFPLPFFVRDHTHRGTHDGQEHGLFCGRCLDGIMGLPDPAADKPTFPA